MFSESNSKALLQILPDVTGLRVSRWGSQDVISKIFVLDKIATKFQRLYPFWLHWAVYAIAIEFLDPENLGVAVGTAIAILSRS